MQLIKIKSSYQGIIIIVLNAELFWVGSIKYIIVHFFEIVCHSKMIVIRRVGWAAVFCLDCLQFCGSKLPINSTQTLVLCNLYSETHLTLKKIFLISLQIRWIYMYPLSIVFYVSVSILDVCLTHSLSDKCYLYSNS